MFYVFHSGNAATDDDRVTIIGPEKLAELVMDAGLITWLIRNAWPGFLSLIHVSDMAEALACAIDDPSLRLLAVTDDRPMRYAGLFTYIAALEGGPAPRSGGPEKLASFSVPNHAAKSALGWAPHCRSVLSGLT
jgi:nucleoside-diphosphate-sugar epimerase